MAQNDASTSRQPLTLPNMPLVPRLLHRFSSNDASNTSAGSLTPDGNTVGDTSLNLPVSRPGSPSSTSGQSSAGEPDENEEEDDEPITEPALASPTTLVHTSPWPFGTVTDGGVINRSRTDSVITTRGVPTSINIPIIGSGNVSMPATPEAAEISSQRNSMTALSFAAAYQQQQILPSSLPHEILLHILRLVHSVSDLKSAILVCKSWCQCGVELLWHKPNFKHSAPLFGFLVVISRGAYAAAPPDANLPYMPLTTHRTFPYATFVKRLNFSMIGSDMTDVILGQLAPCVRLERLTVQGNKVITDLGVVNLLSSCRNLVALDFSECSQLTDGALWAVGANCPRLQGINLSGCVKMTDSGITAIAVGCPSLRRIKLRNVSQITDASLVALAKSCRQLLELDLINCDRLSDATLWAIWRGLSHLRELSFNGGNGMTDAGFPAKTSSGAVVGPLEDEVSIIDISRLPRAEYVESPCRILVPSRNFERMRLLDLTALTNITDVAIASIIAHMPRIRSLVLAKCTSLTDRSVLSICKLGKHLHSLHLGHVGSITDNAVTQLARSCTRLRYIDLACCPLLTDMSVFELSANLHRLKRIGLVRVVNLTDEAIFKLAERKALERIHLSYCDNVSVPAIHYLLQGLNRLTHLSLTGVTSFRNVELQKFCRPPPKEFNSHQRNAFCVYSGAGVRNLRLFLTSRTSAAPDGQDAFMDLRTQPPPQPPRRARRGGNNLVHTQMPAGVPTRPINGRPHRQNGAVMPNPARGRPFQPQQPQAQPVNFAQPGAVPPAQGPLRFQHHAATRLGGSAPASLGSAFQALRAAGGRRPDGVEADLFDRPTTRPPWQARPPPGRDDMDIDDDEDDSDNDRQDDSQDLTDD